MQARFLSIMGRRGGWRQSLLSVCNPKPRVSIRRKQSERAKKEPPGKAYCACYCATLLDFLHGRVELAAEKITGEMAHRNPRLAGARLQGLDYIGGNGYFVVTVA